MPMWRCPHCATPQAETARCWVCHRSTTSCGSCRHFRRSVAAQIGYCGLDRRRSPLNGDEIRGCWESLDPAGATPPPPLTAATAWPLAPGTDRTAVRLLEFVEVRADAPGEARRGTARRMAGEPAAPPDPLASGQAPQWSLWSDADV